MACWKFVDSISKAKSLDSRLIGRSSVESRGMTSEKLQGFKTKAMDPPAFAGMAGKSKGAGSPRPRG
jgi:hypothetical protein